MPKSPSASQKHSPQLARAPPARVRDGRPEGEDPRRGASASPRARFRRKTPHLSKDREACCALRRCGDERLRPPGQSPDQHATRRDIMHLLIPLIWWVERTWPTARFPGNTAMTPRREKRAMSRSSAAETREAGASSSCLIWCRNLFAACLASCDADHTVGKAFILEIHSTHAASGHSRSGFLLGELSHHGLGGDQEARNRSRILQRGANDLRRVDNARLN